MTFELKTTRKPDMARFPGLSLFKEGREGSVEYSASLFEWFRGFMYHADILDTQSEGCTDSSIPFERVHGQLHYREIEVHFMNSFEKPGLNPPEEFAHLDSKSWAVFVRDWQMLRGFRSQRSPLPGKIFARKFSTNDGWVVVPEECMVISEAMGMLLEREKRDSDLTSALDQWTGRSRKAWLRWLKHWQLFNFVASQSGGYEVW